MTDRRPCKVCNFTRQKSYGVVVRSLDELKIKGCEFLGLNRGEPITVVLADDGTLIEDQDYFLCLPLHTKFMLLHETQTWSPVRRLDGSTAWMAKDTVDASSAAPPCWHLANHQLKQDLTSIIFMSEADLQHTPTATPAPPTPKIFKEIYSLLPLSSGGKKKRCKISVEELARRVGPPEYMSFTSLAAYLRTDNNARRELQGQLEEAGIKPTQLTAKMSLFSRLCEEEVNALCESLAGLVLDHLPFQGIHVIPEAEDELLTQWRLSEFRSNMRRAIAAIKENVEAVDLASHGFMSKMLDIILSIFEKCLDNQITST